MARAVAPVNEKDRASCARCQHFTTEHLAGNAARMIALSHDDKEPMLPYMCKVCGDWCLTMQGTGVEDKSERPSRPSRRERALQPRTAPLPYGYGRL